LTPASIVHEGRVRLYERPACIDETLPNHLAWHRSAEQLLALPRAQPPAPDFISGLVPWKRQNAVALLDRISQTTGRHWLRALAGAWHVSEYTLYGRFVRDALGQHSGQYVSASPLCLDYYKRVPLSAVELSGFLERVDRDTIAASFSSKAGMDPKHYVEILERHWASPGPELDKRERSDPDRGSGATPIPSPVGRGTRAGTSRGRTPQRVSASTRSRSERLLRVRSALAASVLAALLTLVVVVALGVD
jgi:hypothetical protein